MGDYVQIEGEIYQAEVSYKPRKSLILKLADSSGYIFLRFIHFYPSHVAILSEGKRVRVSGEVRHGFFGYEMVHPKFKIVSESTPIKDTYTPVYPTTAGLTQASIMKCINLALTNSDLSEILPKKIYEELGLPSYELAIRHIHNPPITCDLEQMGIRESPEWNRLIFDELIAQQLSMRRHYINRKSNSAPAFKPSRSFVKRLVENLPFKLTKAQLKVVNEIEADLSSPFPMQRLLQGDVGSGKTIVATIAALQAIENGFQVAIMAPTEILAEQHYKKIQTWLNFLDLKTVWLSGGQNRNDRREANLSIEDGSASVVVGTHALFQEKVKFKKLGFIIVDEQHRFGVQQRLFLRQKGQNPNGIAPHQLMMSATPIPRTLSMSYFADLDVSVIDELPPGRSPITTKLVSEKRREEILERVHHACINGEQAYWVCPLIEESEALQLKTAIETFNYLQSRFTDIKIGLLHGRMKSPEKQEIMHAFKNHEIHLLVATTVIEVGVDVPNASLMIIEHAERMGLSQLHQLRGRVGRGASKSTCILIYQNPLSEVAKQRLITIYESNDGFEIAKADLSIRGPGEFLGVKQSGVPMLKIANLEKDIQLLEAAKEISISLLKNYPVESEMHIRRWLGDSEELVKV